MNSKGSRLRGLFSSDRTEIVPIGPLAIHAQMAERAGFGAFQISGAMAAWWLNGLPDAGIVPRTEIIENARRVVQAVGIPIYCDADTGYGGVQNVRRTVHDFVHAGVAGIHIEDQVEPKKAGSQAGVAVVSDAEAIGRLNAACDARDELDPDFVVVGRTDAYSASGGDISEAIRRASLYRERTGVDAVMIEAVRTWDEARRALAEVPRPAYVTVSFLNGPTPSVDEQSEMGQAIRLLPFVTPGVSEVWKLLLQVRDAGEVWPCDEYLTGLFQTTGEEYVGAGDAFVRPTYAQIREWEERYLPPGQHRTYWEQRNAD